MHLPIPYRFLGDRINHTDSISIPRRVLYRNRRIVYIHIKKHQIPVREDVDVMMNSIRATVSPLYCVGGRIEDVKVQQRPRIEQDLAARRQHDLCTGKDPG